METMVSVGGSVVVSGQIRVSTVNWLYQLVEAPSVSALGETLFAPGRWAGYLEAMGLT